MAPASDRLAEVAGLLALGLIRRKVRQARKTGKSATGVENPLDPSGTLSIHVLEDDPKGERP